MKLWNAVEKTNPKYTKQVGFGRKFTSIKDSDGENSFRINSSIGTHSKAGKLDDECYKKVSTDALTKGLSKLGFNADVFLGQWDDNRYVSQMKKEFAEKPVKDKHAPGTKMTAEVFKLMQEAIKQGKGEKVKERMEDYVMTKVQKDKLIKELV